MTLTKNAKLLKYQTQYYEIITNLILYKDSEETLYPFLSRLDLPIKNLLEQINSGVISDTCKCDMQNLVYIFIGIMRSFKNSSYFDCFFEWFYPDQFRLLHKALLFYQGDIDSQKSFIKLLQEFTDNSFHKLKMENICGFTKIGRASCRERVCQYV